MNVALKDVKLDKDFVAKNPRAEAIEWLKAYRKRKEEEACQNEEPVTPVTTK